MPTHRRARDRLPERGSNVEGLRASIVVSLGHVPARLPASCRLSLFEVCITTAVSQRGTADSESEQPLRFVMLAVVCQLRPAHHVVIHDPNLSQLIAGFH